MTSDLNGPNGAVGGGGVTVRWWAAAKAAAGSPEDVLPAGRLDQVLEAACQRRAGAGAELRQVLQRCSFLADEVRVDRDTELRAGTVVDVLPPFAGG